MVAPTAATAAIWSNSSQARRTDKIREAVAGFLAGDLTKKQLERVFHDTDYSMSVGE